MTYNVLSGTLSLYTTTTTRVESTFRRGFRPGYHQTRHKTSSENSTKNTGSNRFKLMLLQACEDSILVEQEAPPRRVFIQQTLERTENHHVSTNRKLNFSCTGYVPPES